MSADPGPAPVTVIEPVTVVVPTLGRSPVLAPCLEALRGEGARVVVVDQGAGATRLPAGLADLVLRPGRNLGFAGGTNLGLAEAAGEWVATVNDDCLVAPGWLGALTGALAAEPRAAAAQGVNFRLDDPSRVDGCGIAWNRAWQAVQAGRDRDAPAASEPEREVFGVSATAAVFRRSALAAVARSGGEVFDERLGSYYEDVDLAVRLRAAGFGALLVPRARSRHAGSATGGGLGARRIAAVYGNRWLVLAALLGRTFLRRLPAIGWRDVKDLARALGSGEGSVAAGILAGWARALALLPGYLHRGAPALPLAALTRFREGG